MTTETYQELHKLNGENVLHPMSMPAFDNESPTFMKRGEGVHVWDSEDNQYLDGLGGLWCVNVGYGRKEVLDAMRDQMDQLAYYNTFGDMCNLPSTKLATKIIDMLRPEGMSKVFFTSGGSDSIDSSIKLARQFWRLNGKPTKTALISLKDAYHGVHMGGISLIGIPAFRNPYGPVLPGCYQIDNPFLYRNPWTEDPEELGQICADILDRKIAYLGADNVAAFIAEPIQGAGGVIVPPENYWPLIRKVCDKHDVLLIADEVVTGFGRSGSMFGVRGWGVAADIMCFAKGISSGYVPLGATVINERIADSFSKPSPDGMVAHGLTYSGHPLACAAGIAALDVVVKENLHINAGEVGAYCKEKFMTLVDRHEHLGEVRGKGLMLALDLVTDKATGTPVNPAEGYSDMLAAHCQQNGVLIRSVGPKIILSPPLTFTTDNVNQLVGAIDQALTDTKYPT